MAQSNLKEEIINFTNVLTGGQTKSKQLYFQLKNSIDKAKRIDIIVSFLMESGVRLLLKDLKQAVAKKIPIRILTGNYLNITQPSALYLIKQELNNQVDLRFYDDNIHSFHPKAYFFHYDDYSEIYIGSSNISRSALTSGIEWNYRFNNLLDKDSFQQFFTTFEDLFYNHAIVITDEELYRYAKYWRKPAIIKDLEQYKTENKNITPLIQPRGVQIEALYALNNSRNEGATKALIHAATGIGKTYYQKYNANYLKMRNEDKDYTFIPNMESNLLGVDYYIKRNGGECYISHEEAIIDKYLFKEDSLEIDVFDMNNYDISTICYVANCGLNFMNESFRKVIHEILLCMIDIWNYTKENNNAYKIFDGYQKYEIIELFQREIVQAPKDEIMAIDMLFEKIDFTKFTTDTIEFYQDIFVDFLCEFFDSYVDLKKRNKCKSEILYIEKKVNNINEEYVRMQLYKSLMLSVTRFYKGDWSKIKTTYKYSDKQFLNDQFTKYGKYYIEELLETIYQMHIDELLPEILISIRNSFQSAKSDMYRFEKSIRNQEVIVQLIILKSFVVCSDKIKQDQELTEAYEDILEILIELNYEQAAVILDEFRIH